jgi:hypothetical protein
MVWAIVGIIAFTVLCFWPSSEDRQRCDMIDKIWDDVATRELLEKILSVPKYETLVRELLSTKEIR